MTSRGQPAQGIDKADAVDGNALLLGSLHHGHADHVIDQQEHGQFLENAADGLAAERLHLYRRFDVAEGSLNGPPQPISLGQFFGRVFAQQRWRALQT